MLQELPDKVSRKVVRQAVTEMAKPMESDIIAHAPRITGEAAGTIETVIRRSKTKTAAKIQTVDSSFPGGEFYIRFSEVGRHDQVAKPFFRPAFDRNVQQAITIATESLRQGILDVMKV